MRKSSGLLAVMLIATAFPAIAAPCKDARGKFIKCPPVKAGPCKDARGKFVKCGTAGSVPVKK